MKGKTKSQKGITLVALIITVVILLILAVVAVTAIQNDGILAHSNNATGKYNQKQDEENVLLNGYEGILNNYTGNGGSGSESTEGEGSGDSSGSGSTDEEGSEGTTQTVATVKNTVLSTTSNTDVYDEYGNKIVVPAGFKIRVDDTTNNAETVTEGIVIEDGTNGNQFVWIPVGTVYTNEEQTTSETITLGRYSFDSTTGEPSAYSGSYTEDTVASHNSSYGNAISRDIEAFIASTDPTTGNGGYYLGRYEARKNSNGDLTTISTDTVWNNVNQATASSESQGMYADGYSSGTFSSDLINSYAWDTALVFLQTFDNRADKTKPYSGQNSLNTSLSTTGTTIDVICNIYDMASNCYEWSTETSTFNSIPCVGRGGDYNNSNSYTYSRGFDSTSTANDTHSFRSLLYVGL